MSLCGLVPHSIAQAAGDAGPIDKGAGAVSILLKARNGFPLSLVSCSLFSLASMGRFLGFVNKNFQNQGITKYMCDMFYKMKDI